MKQTIWNYVDCSRLLSRIQGPSRSPIKYALMRALNAREGLARDQDTLPKKLFRKALSGGRSDGLVLDQAELDAGLEDYYRQAGWDTNSGVPKRETLENLGLGWAADDLGL